MEPSQPLNLYITFVEKEGPFLKLWGQTEKNNAIYVEQFLAGIGAQFNAGVGRVPPESLQCGTLVCAKYKDDKYYRARIVNIFVRDSFVEVMFIDFGNKDIISCENIRSLHNCPSSFISIPALAIGFIFAEAHCVGGGEWNETIFESISKEIRYREVQCQLSIQASQYYLVKIYLDGTDLCSLLIQRGLMQPISLQAQQAVLLSMSLQRQTSQVANPTQTTAAINTYKAVTLEPGCQYPVYVSYVNDGPCQFSVQLKQSENILAKLMKDINCITLRLLEDVPIPGTLCLARCQEDGNVCRAVVTNEVDNQFKVYYVDFGNYEIVSLDSLFQIPFKYVIPKVMAIRFALAGVEKSTVTVEMQVAFKKFVDNRMLHMRVLPANTRMAVPKCELWDPENKTSALDVVNRAAKHAYPEPIPLTRGFSQPVKVSFVYSCSRFYVQLVSKENELTSLMMDLQEICQTSSLIEPSEIKPGLPCCALFLVDNQWYRSQVVEVLGETVKVRYIDFGNEEEVHITQLKTIDGEQLTVLRPQAIECCLNGYQNMDDDLERDGFLEEIILEDTFTMKVVEMSGKKALVELFDASNYNVSSLLLDKIAAAKSQVSPMLVQAGNKIEHRKSHSQRDGQTPQREGYAQQREGYAQQREGQRDNFRGDRYDKTGRDDSNWNSRSNDRSEKPWRQDNRGNKQYDKNSNDNNERNSWRDNNKGFSPNHQRQGRPRNPDGDSWNNKENTNNNTDWNASGGTAASDSWETTANTNSNTLKNDDWNTPNDGDSWQNKRQNNYDKNKRGYDNDRGPKFDRGDRFAGKQREGGYGKKPDFRKDGSEHSSSGSEKGFHKGPRTSSRNDRGGRSDRNYDKPRGGASYNNSVGDDSWNVSAVVPSIDAAPAAAAFSRSDVVGTEAKVIISWFHNPGHFFCQIVDSQPPFKTMMEEIQEFYKDRKPELSVVGAPVIGLFPEDNVLYRAQVLEIVGTRYKVFYVDFGNVSTIDKIWPIDKKFMNLPAQAIVCSLNGVMPSGDNWSDPDSFSKYFEKENFTCSFVNKDEEKTYVNIFYESEDIAQLLIQDGLAVSTQLAIPDIEISLLLGQQFRAVIKSVNNPGDIILALECGVAVNCAMHNLDTATEVFEDELKALLEQTVIVYVDNVIDDRLEITLYDTEGNKHVILNPDEGAIDTVECPCPMLVLRSTVTGYVPYADETSVFIQPSEYSELVAYLLDQLFETYNDQPQESPIIPEEGHLYAVHSEDDNWYRGRVVSFDDEKATVSYVDYGNSEDVTFDKLRELTPNFLEILILALQVMVSTDAKSYFDREVTANIWFGEYNWEGTVEPLESSATESTKMEELADTGFASESLEIPHAVQDTTESSTCIAEEAAEVELVNHDVGHPTAQDETAVASVDAEAETALVAEAESALVAEAESAPVAAVEEDGGLPRIPEDFVSVGTPVYTSHVDSPNEFYLQFHEALSEIEELQNEIQSNVSDWSVLENPSTGIVCVAPYSGDQLWYRAEILDCDDDITTVRFIDFGNTDVIDNKTTQIKTLPPKLLSLAIYATRCSLKVEPVDEEWSPAAIALFEELAMADCVSAEFLDQNEKTNYVELYSNGANVEDKLIEQKFAVKRTRTQETKSTGFVSHLNSPSEFWIQLENCVDELEWIAEQLSSAETFAELEDLTPGTLCAALFSEDQMWYRARILSNTVAGIELLFIDYGNSCTSSSLRQLPEDLVVTAPLAQKCSLQKPEGIAVWSPEAAAKFAEISAEGQTIFVVKKIGTGETCTVQLFLDGEDVSAMLLPVTEDGYVKAAEGLEQLHVEKADGEAVEGTFQLEPLSGQDLNDEAVKNFEQLNSQGSTLFQIEFTNSNTVRLYLNGYDIRPQLGGMRNTSYEIAELEGIDFTNINMMNEMTNKEDFTLPKEELDTVPKEIDISESEIKIDVQEEVLVEEPNSDSLTPCQEIDSSKLAEELVDEILNGTEALLEKCSTENVFTTISPLKHDHLNEQACLSSDIDAKPMVIKSSEQIDSDDINQIQDENIKSCECEPPEESDDVQEALIQKEVDEMPKDIFSNEDFQNNDDESAIQGTGEIYSVENLPDSSVKSSQACSNLEFQDDTLHNAVEFVLPTSIISEQLKIEEASEICVSIVESSFSSTNSKLIENVKEQNVAEYQLATSAVSKENELKETVESASENLELEASENEPPTVDIIIPEQSVMADSVNVSCPIEDISVSSVESPLSSTNSEPADTVQNFPINLSPICTASSEVPEMEQISTESHSFEKVTLSPVKSPLTIAEEFYKENITMESCHQNSASVQDSCQTFNVDEFEPSVHTGNLDELQTEEYSESISALEQHNTPSPEEVLGETEEEQSQICTYQSLEEGGQNPAEVVQGYTSSIDSFPTTPEENILDTNTSNSSADSQQSSEVQKLTGENSFDHDMAAENLHRDSNDDQRDTKTESLSTLQGNNLDGKSSALPLDRQLLELKQSPNKHDEEKHPDSRSEEDSFPLNEPTRTVSEIPLTQAADDEISFITPEKLKMSPNELSFEEDIAADSSEEISDQKNQNDGAVLDNSETSKIMEDDSYSQSEECSSASDLSKEPSLDKSCDNICSETKEFPLGDSMMDNSECKISPSREKVTKASVKPDLVKGKIAPISPTKSNIRVSLSVAKVLASKDVISSPPTTPKKSSKDTSSPKEKIVSKTSSKQTSVQTATKSSSKSSKTSVSELVEKSQVSGPSKKLSGSEPLKKSKIPEPLKKSVVSEPSKKSPSVVESAKRTTLVKTNETPKKSNKTGVTSKESHKKLSSAKTVNPETSGKDINIKDESCDKDTVVLKKSSEKTSEKNNGTECKVEESDEKHHEEDGSEV